jgi:hypothetical protein
MKVKLKYRQEEMNLPKELLVQYDVTDLIPHLKGLLLSRKGITTSVSEQATAEDSHFLSFCTGCLGNLRRKTTSRPMFAVANGLFIGEIDPEFRDSTHVECAMTNRAQASVFVSTVFGGEHRKIKGNAYTFLAKQPFQRTCYPGIFFRLERLVLELLVHTRCLKKWHPRGKCRRVLRG